ncbi:MAG: hypothetical protein ACLT60_04140 [Hominenteromicrobium sp.]|uniref:hypothetical protein n=1 Tax=Hominenteromicrobium TaxID=3073575 RepID=UPI000EC9DE00|nr:hypothetical protein [Oscillospiraceae bacterium]
MLFTSNCSFCYLENHSLGEWFASGKNSPDEENSHLLCGPWKCPYHNARAAFEIYERCEALEK